MKNLLVACEAHLSGTVAMIEALVRLESPSTDKAAVDRCGAALAGMLREAGAAVETLPQRERGDHVRARFPGDGAPILILGHFDTVWPVGTLERMPLHRDGDRLHGPGSFDMKAGIALALTAMAALRAAALPHRPVTMLWTTDEEIGSATSRATIELEARNAAAVLVLEPALPGGALKTARKGCGEFELTVHGVAAHAGLDPGKGASAIHELAGQIAAVERLQDLPRGISVNVGLVSGGNRRPGADAGGGGRRFGGDRQAATGPPADASYDYRRVRAAADGTHRGSCRAVREGVRRRRRPGARAWGGQRRWRLGRQLHRGGRRADPRRARRGR